MDSLVRHRHLPPWRKRQEWLTDYLEESMCLIRRAVDGDPAAPSLALVRPKDVSGLEIWPHPGWTEAEKRKIEQYVGQLEMFADQDRTPLEAPRFKARYAYRCHDRSCKGHKQGILDWEFVALQRHLRGRTDEEIKQQLTAKFLDQMCGADRDPAFFVGNQAKHLNTFSVLGVFWPPRKR